ncbi:putative metacaspase [Mycosarcoma maydis]|uniref:Metacaspase-1 n=1 Tax=Mycosarcoma maydis TaxID=5270 RepID=MCA1_MYCMD|nr:putative metacaspase [Ustilago maydis 521]Q4PEQ5.1 RecName: Full=Metacaspase-1; Flags: Precursor [Ustilago maydis 521]KIS71513.1 putative metacaspase [Ustilago maydis 521]|eukprot:XP_011387285.1 putative metacaspase [Ustilago maydis 521]
MAYPGQGGHHYQSTHGGGGGGFPAPHGYAQPGYGYAPPSGPPQGYQSGGGYAPPMQPPPGGVQGQMGYGFAPPSGPIGPPEYATNHVNYNPQGGMIGNQRYEYSSMQGKRKALLIGINYFGQNGELRGCINDVRNVQNFLRQRGYKDDDMVVLTDDQRDARSIPTRQNMTAAMHWLVRGAQPGDALFFHYSGHGGQAKATQGDEADGYNETIIPLDYQQAGQIEDDELHAIMVRPLPVGCRLTAIFDSCHSGTALDLPYVYTTSGNVKEPNVIAGVGKGIMGAAMNYARGDVLGMAKGLFSTFTTAKNTSGAEEVTKQTRSSGADVVMLSGCKDSQTSADATEAGKATGACSFAFLSVMNQYPQLTYKQMLNAVRDVLASKYSQKPQLSSSHPIDMDLLFVV